jgi:hypothetical protein
MSHPSDRRAGTGAVCEANTRQTTLTILIAMLLVPLAALHAVDPAPAAPGANQTQVGVYYFPNWGPVAHSEWKSNKAAKPRFEGHAQPKIPVWGYENENDPVVMARKIAPAADHGIDAFIFDWYYYDPDASGLEGQKLKASPWEGSKYLYSALEHGYLGAANNDRLKFAIMWCNHNLGAKVKGAVTPETFETLTNYVIEKYFKHPSYWKIAGCPYFSVYQVETLLETFGGDRAKAAAALVRFRERVKAAGFPGLHVNGVLFGLGGKEGPAVAKALGLDSATTYTWIHHFAPPRFPATDFGEVADAYFRAVEKGGGWNGLEQPAAALPVPYHLNVSMGWDSSPRCKGDADWMTIRRGYPYGPVIVNNTPERFRSALLRAKEITLRRPPNERVITINSWNEWGEGSYLEPDTVHGMKYLEAARDVFGTIDARKKPDSKP